MSVWVDMVPTYGYEYEYVEICMVVLHPAPEIPFTGIWHHCWPLLCTYLHWLASIQHPSSIPHIMSHFMSMLGNNYSDTPVTSCHSTTDIHKYVNMGGWFLGDHRRETMWEVTTTYFLSVQCRREAEGCGHCSFVKASSLCSCESLLRGVRIQNAVDMLLLLLRRHITHHCRILMWKCL